MDKRIEQYWIKKYPDLFAGCHLGIYKSAMSWGCTCGEGWFDILDQLWKDLDELEGVVLGQVKEKFAGLRVYLEPMSSNDFDEAHRLIDEAEVKSFKTCEVCGKPGKVHGDGWVFTACDDCKGLDRDARWALAEQISTKIIIKLGIGNVS